MEEELEISEMGDMFSKNICLASTEEDCCPLWPASSPLDRLESTCSRAVVIRAVNQPSRRPSQGTVRSVDTSSGHGHPKMLHTELWFTSKEGGLVSVLLP